jgi:hypothetical protein
MAAAAIQQQRDAQMQQMKFQQEMKRLHRDLNSWMQGILEKGPHAQLGALAPNWVNVRKFFEKMHTQSPDVLLDGLGVLYEFVSLWDVPGAIFFPHFLTFSFLR